MHLFNYHKYTKITKKKEIRDPQPFLDSFVSFVPSWFNAFCFAPSRNCVSLKPSHFGSRCAKLAV